MSYQNASTNALFTPSIAFRDYQNYRLALSKPQHYRMFYASTERDDT